MKRAISIAILFCAVQFRIFPSLAENAIAASAQNSLQTRTDFGEESIEKEMVEAFHRPFRFCRSQKHLQLLSMLEKNIYPTHFILSADSIQSLIQPVKDGKNIQKNFILNILLFAMSKNNDKARACTALQTAASIALYNMKEPETALRLYKIGDGLTCPAAKDSLFMVENFIKTDSRILDLLNVNYVKKNMDGKKEYLTFLQHELARHPKARLKNDALKRIGDVAFLLHDNHTMLKYYSEAVANNPRMALSSSILLRMKTAKSIILRRRLWIVCILGYFIALLLFVIRILRGRGFNFAFFLKRTFYFVLAFIIFGFVILLIDQNIFHASLFNWLKVQQITLNRPIIALGLPSALPRILIIKIIAVSFIPVLYALIYTSFRRSFSRILLLFAVVVVMTASWLHFSLDNIFDAEMRANGFFTGSHFYFRGSLDDLLEKNPKVLVKAVENAPKEEKEKVMEVIRQHEKINQEDEVDMEKENSK